MVTEPPIETGVDFMELGKGKGVFTLKGANLIRFRDVGGLFCV